MTTLTDRLNAIRERRDTAFRFPTSASKQAASVTDVLPLLEAVEAVDNFITEQLYIPHMNNGGHDDGYDTALLEVRMTLTKHLGGGDDEQ